ncbi:MAG TPA: extracellular solute-binding protein [Candidatus Avimonas sp.]|jgi:ABC-type glycerol-3-phosphate transport system substrate-binding protein|nr:extracellular solute-binding protein [Candidatus Avimonas sp.]
MAANIIAAAFMPAAASDKDTAAEEFFTGTFTDISQQYLTKRKQYSNVPFAQEDIVLPIEGSELDQSSRIINDTKLSPAPVIRLGGSGQTSWKVNVQNDAQYVMEITYRAVEDTRQDLLLSLLIDGELPFAEAESIALNRIWRDATPILTDEKGNDLIPLQEEVLRFTTTNLKNSQLFTNDDFYIYLQQGEHTISIKNNSTDIYIAGVRLTKPKQIKTDGEAIEGYSRSGYREIEDALIIHQGENTFEKSSQSIFPQYDRTSPATVPYHVSNIKRNVIGKNGWNIRGDWISWIIRDVPEDGLYYLSFKYLQDTKLDMPSYRNVYVNGELPSQSFVNVEFKYNVQWKNKTVTDKNGAPVPVYLKKGDNEIRLEASLGDITDAYRRIEEACHIMRDLYIKMVMICGTSPDKYRDYHLEKDIPELIPTFEELISLISQAAEEIDSVNRKKSSQSVYLWRAVAQIESFIDDPSLIPSRIGNFRSTITTLTDWLFSSSEQPLTLDYIMVHSLDTELPPPVAGFLDVAKHIVGSFIASFTADYYLITDMSGSKEYISVWANMGRDQVQVLRDLIIDDFTPRHNIEVSLSLVQSGFVEAILAGVGPDLAVGIARGQPINLAGRGVLQDLTEFDSFPSVAGRFADTALVPYTLNRGVYALPNTQTFFMMFYRKDIFETLKLRAPDTWDDVMALVARLQKRNMTFGLPYTILNAAAAIDLGMGSKDMFSILLLQNGGSYYHDNGRRSALNDDPARKAFKTWCEMYNQYGFDLIYDFYTRFRYGEMPIGIANVEFYNTLVGAAPDIKGLWEIAPVPGTKTEHGIDRSIGGSGTALVMFNSAKNPENAWKFMDWWTTSDVQTKYSQRVENLLGTKGRFYTANLEAFYSLGWSRAELNALKAQREWLKEIMEVPGSYFVSRSLDNAFRAVIYDNKNPMESLEKEVLKIDREIARKRKELRLD